MDQGFLDSRESDVFLWLFFHFIISFEADLRNPFPNGPFSYSSKETWIERSFCTFLYATFDGLALELLSVLCRFENSTEFSKTPFDSDSFQNS